MLKQSIQELAQDLKDLSRLVENSKHSLEAFDRLVDRQPSFFGDGSRDAIHELASATMEKYDRLLASLRASLDESRQWIDEADVQRASTIKKNVRAEWRALVSVAAGIIASLDWQSPSFAHTKTSHAGRLTGRIRGTENDYKRDHHSDAEEYERAFKKAYIASRWHQAVNVYAASSGMAAFSTAAVAIHGVLEPHAAVIVGQDSYFENKKVLRQLFGDRLIFVNEMDTDALLAVIEQSKAGAVFLDTLCNTESLAMPDIARLLSGMTRLSHKPLHLVLDNTALGPSCQPLEALPLLSRLNLCVIESLNKYHEFGMDRVTGGILWTRGPAHLDIFRTRMHSGTNIQDASVFALPAPDAPLLRRRLERFERNARWLATTLDAHIRSLPNSPFAGITFPALDSHPSQAWNKTATFHGSCFVIKFSPKHAQASRYEAFLKTIMRIAEQRGIDLVAGTSFGLDTTRVYVTARHADKDAQPFFRVAVGTETLFELSQLGDVFRHAIDLFARSV